MTRTGSDRAVLVLAGALLLGLLPLACSFDEAGIGYTQPKVDLRDGPRIGDAPPPDARQDQQAGDLQYIPSPDLGADAPGDGFSCGICPAGCDPSTGFCRLFDVSNVDPEYLRLGSGTLLIEPKPDGSPHELSTNDGRLNGEEIKVAGTGTFTTPPTSGAPNGYMVLFAGRLELAQNAVLRVGGERPLIVLASERIIIKGTIDAAASGRTPGAGGGAGGERAQPGRGCGAGEPGQKQGGLLGWFEGSGAAGGSHYGKGGKGGDGPLARSPCIAQGAATPLIPLSGGSGGGGGARNGGNGGGGGGALQLSALYEISIEGVTRAGGGGGGRGNTGLSNDGPGTGGGGGSGGGILIEARDVVISGRVVANGGGGGGASHDLVSGNDGEGGKDAKERAAGGKGGDELFSVAGSGGDGSGDGKLEAGDGTDSYDRGGGGGGGAGVIWIRSIQSFTGAALISPDAISGDIYWQ